VFAVFSFWLCEPYVPVFLLGGLWLRLFVLSKWLYGLFQLRWLNRQRSFFSTVLSELEKALEKKWLTLYFKREYTELEEWCLAYYCAFGYRRGWH
jgi:hypothetical protein